MPDPITDIVVPGFERVTSYTDSSCGLRAIVAVHSTTRGPALGGVRMRNYATDQDALDDCLACARAMTLKAALAGLQLGGGWSVITGDPARHKTRELLLSFGRFVARLGGPFIPVNDVGTTQEDIAVIGTVTSPVCAAGDPSPFTALGVLESIRGCLELMGGSDNLRGVRVSVQGAGNVGAALVKLLAAAGCEVLVADIDHAKAEVVAATHGARSVGAGELLDVPCDVLAPCATGKVVTGENVSSLRCRLIAGGANNILATAELESTLAARGIVYAPDFCTNAGGLIFLAEQILGHDRAQAEARVRRIRSTVVEILRLARERQISATQSALELARQRLTN